MVVPRARIVPGLVVADRPGPSAGQHLVLGHELAGVPKALELVGTGNSSGWRSYGRYQLTAYHSKPE